MLSLDHAAHADDQALPSRSSLHRLNRRTLYGAILSIATLTASATSAAWAQAVQLAVVDVKTVAQGFQLSKLIGVRVNNDKDEKIGALEDLILTKDHNLIAILQVGGFLGLGGYLVAVPYDSLNISDDGRKISLAGASKEELKKLPEFQFKN
jgi:DNA uptake protein ComE-like DNA-binding protein